MTASPDSPGAEDAEARRYEAPRPAMGRHGERWSAERLRRLQEQVLIAEGYAPRSDFDVGVLPEEEHSWDTWAAAPEVPHLADTTDEELAIGALDRWRAEVGRRQNLVEHARALIALARLQADEEDAADAVARLQSRHAQKLAQDRSWLRAADVADALFVLPPAVRSRAAALTLRCPDRGCRLAQVFPRRQDREPSEYAETLLIVVEHQRRFAWAVRPGQTTAFPPQLPIDCRHGRGHISTEIAHLVGRSAGSTCIATDFEGASWTARH